MGKSTNITVVYKGRHDAVNTPDGTLFKQGEPVTVAAELGESLIGHDFESFVERNSANGDNS